MEKYKNIRRRDLWVRISNVGTRNTGKRKRDIRKKSWMYLIYIRPDGIGSAYSSDIYGTISKRWCLQHDLRALGGGMRMGGEIRNSPKASASVGIGHSEIRASIASLFSYPRIWTNWVTGSAGIFWLIRANIFCPNGSLTIFCSFRAARKTIAEQLLSIIRVIG